MREGHGLFSWRSRNITPADNYDKKAYPLFIQSLAHLKIYAISIVYLQYGWKIIIP
jgi:hypothetical protein